MAKAIDLKQKYEAYEVWRAVGSKPQVIRDVLVEKFTEYEAPSLRTINNWIAHFKSIATSLDEPFEWHRIEDYERDGLGLAWEAGKYVLDLWYDAWEHISMLNRLRGIEGEWRESPDAEAVRGGIVPEAEALNAKSDPSLSQLIPTVREVRWWWRIHLARPDLDSWRVRILGGVFAAREVVASIQREPAFFKDLEGFLAHEPWKDEIQEKRYARAVNEKRVPPLRDLDIVAKAIFANTDQQGVWLADPRDWSVTHFSRTAEENDER